MNWRRYNWLSDILLPAAFACLRACWLWPWLEFVRCLLIPSEQQALLALPLMLAIFLGGLAAARIARGNLARARLAVAILGLFVAFLTLWWRYCRPAYPLWDMRWMAGLATGLTHWGDELPGPLVTLLAAAYLWWRGLLDGREPTNTDRIWNAFGIGLVALATGLLAVRLATQSIPAEGVSLVLVHFSAGMVSLAVCSLQLAAGATLTPAEVPANANRYWLATVALVVCAILTLGVLLSMIIAPEAVTRALAWGSFLLSALGRVLIVVVYAISYVVFLILNPLLQWLQSRFQAQSLSEETQAFDWEQQLAELQQGVPPSDEAMAESLRWVGLAGLLAIIALAFSLALLLYRRSNGQKAAGELRESIFSRDLLASQLSGLWQRWRRRMERPGSRLSPYLSLEGEVPTRRAIRAVYQRLLASAQARGYPRPPAETPAQYRKALSAMLPEIKEDLDQLTSAYEEARYAGTPPSAERAGAAALAWQRIRATLAHSTEHTGNEPAAPSEDNKTP